MTCYGCLCSVLGQPKLKTGSISTLASIFQLSPAAQNGFDRHLCSQRARQIHSKVPCGKRLLSTVNNAQRGRWKEVQDLVARYDRRTYSTEPEVAFDRKIYIMGMGATGILVAHSLASAPQPPPVTLLMYRERELRSFVDAGSKLELRRRGTVDIRDGFGAERTLPPETSTDQDEDNTEKITNLVLAVRGYGVGSAINRIKHRLTSDSTVLILNNVVGFLDEVYAQHFPIPAERPHILVGRVDHDVWSESSHSARHTGVGSVTMSTSFGHLPMRDGSKVDGISHMAPSSRYILRSLSRAPSLGGVGMPSIDFFQLQLERLAVDAIVHPLTTIYECANGQLFENFHISRVAFLMLAEISLVLRSLPELQHLPGIEQRFSAERLRQLLIAHVEATANTESSMLRDWRERKPTEISHLTGYIIRRGEEVGIRCIINYAMMQMVFAKRTMLWKHDDNLLPFESHQ